MPSNTVHVSPVSGEQTTSGTQPPQDDSSGREQQAWWPTSASIPFDLTDPQMALHRRQTEPCQAFSKRWKTMELVDIKDWASQEVKSITLSQIFLDAPYHVEVREFVPLEGDMVDEKWTTADGIVKTHPVPRYALADIHQSAEALCGFVTSQKTIRLYLDGALKKSDELVQATYNFAFDYSQNTQSTVHRDLLTNIFEFWVACIKTRNPEHIVGSEKLGGTAVNDPGSPNHGRHLMPPIIIPQAECILFSKILVPKEKAVLETLERLIREKKNEDWLAIYLSTFILLHSCSMTSLRDWETGQRYNQKDEYANPESIRQMQASAEALLARFHDMSGAASLALVNDAAGSEELRSVKGLSDEQVEFIASTWKLIQDPSRAERMETARVQGAVNGELYYIQKLCVNPGDSAGRDT